MSKQSEIQKFFSGTKVFLTGATGFIGKMVLEKLLRSCDVEHVYILVRIKKGKEQNERSAELLKCPIFDGLKQNNPDFDAKISLFHGDLLEPDLGLNEKDRTTIIEEVNIVIHCAATVRFDQKLSQATKINVRATRDLLNIAKKMKHLKSFVHVSTAFSNCDRKEVDERVYEPKLEGHKLIQAVDALNDELLYELQPKLLGKLPNTYTLTKQVTEDLVKHEAQELPLCIVRPSIVVGAVKEPIEGFIDNYYGPTGLFFGVALGVLKAALINSRNRADLVPADFVVNHILAAAWHTGSKRLNREPRDPEVLNLVSGVHNPLTWGDFMDYLSKIGVEYATRRTLWYPFLIVQTNEYIHSVLHLSLHVIPAYIADAVARLTGKEPIFVKAVTKMSNAAEIIAYFPMNEWTFQDTNTRKLWEKLPARDKEMFNFDVKSFNWYEYTSPYIKAIRVYIVGDPLDTIEEGKAHYRKLKYIHYTVILVLLMLLYYVLKTVFRILF